MSLSLSRNDAAEFELHPDEYFQLLKHSQGFSDIYDLSHLILLFNPK